MAFENRYSALDRAMHRVAFLTGPAQIALSGIEDQLFKKTLATIEITKPIFITALPRAGTTLLLEILASQDEFASHSYRNMPFVLVPMFWDRFTAAFRHSDIPRQRAHGDGMLVNINSPEAFEEMVWKAFWPQHYRTDHIAPWGDESIPEFTDFLFSHMRKIIALRGNESATPAALRYLSKNNPNISRLGVIQRNFPDAILLIPFRHPLQHANSLLKQHLNFLKIHKQDSFARRYMAAIGHYDFGENLRPIDFNGWFTSAQSLDPTTISFWINYWIATYEHLLKQANAQIGFLSYEALCKRPIQNLEQIADFIEVREHDAFIEQHSRISAIKPHPVDTRSIDPAELQRAEALYTSLKKVSLL